MYALLCGTGYGASYLPVLANSSSIKLAGILSRGSDRSIYYARSKGVPHHLSLDEIADKQINLVIVAVSGEAGFNLAIESLRRGFHVIAEHPWRAEHIEIANATAVKSKSIFHINGHWGDLKHGLEFIQACKVARKYNPPSFVSLMTNPRTLYSALDLVARSVGELVPESFAGIQNQSPDDPFAILYGRGGEAQLTIQNQRFTSAIDDGTYALVNHHCVIGFPHGHLTLSEASAPGTWTPEMSSLIKMGAANHSLPLAAKLGTDEPPTLDTFLNKHRPEANRFALERLILHVKEGTAPPEQSYQHHMMVAQTWERCIELTGKISLLP